MILRYSSLHLKLSSSERLPMIVSRSLSMSFSLSFCYLSLSFFFLVLSIVLSFSFSSLVRFRSLSFSTLFILSRPCSFFLYLFSCFSLLLSFCLLVLPPPFAVPLLVYLSFPYCYRSAWSAFRPVLSILLVVFLFNVLLCW